jgi:hypothetical protein
MVIQVHVRPCVIAQRVTGFVTEIENLRISGIFVHAETVDVPVHGRCPAGLKRGENVSDYLCARDTLGQWTVRRQIVKGKRHLLGWYTCRSKQASCNQTEPKQKARALKKSTVHEKFSQKSGATTVDTKTERCAVLHLEQFAGQ